jgi:hypothetical protein
MFNSSRGETQLMGCEFARISQREKTNDIQFAWRQKGENVFRLLNIVFANCNFASRLQHATYCVEQCFRRAGFFDTHRRHGIGRAGPPLAFASERIPISRRGFSGPIAKQSKLSERNSEELHHARTLASDWDRKRLDFA